MILVVKVISRFIMCNEKGPLLAFFRLITTLVFVFLVSCSENQNSYVFVLEGKTMGTTYQVKALANHRTIISESALQIQVDKKLESFNQIASTYLSDSELSLLNQAEIAEWHVLSEVLFDLIKVSMQISEKTSGVFDVTVGPLVNLWGFGPEKHDVEPTDEDVEQLLQNIGHRYIELKPESLEFRKQKDIYIDLSAIAKGYGVDMIAQQLSEFGFNDFMVEIGGEIYVSGNNPDGKPWIIGVEKPSLAHAGAIQAIGISGVGVATSGDYRNYYEKDGKRISHTIDPVKGFPISHNLASVTVVAESSIYADAYATALNVMGPENGLKYAIANDMAAYFIIREEQDFVVRFTPEFARLMKSL